LTLRRGRAPSEASLLRPQGLSATLDDRFPLNWSVVPKGSEHVGPTEQSL
jgi:hypothetical protein